MLFFAMLNGLPICAFITVLLSTAESGIPDVNHDDYSNIIRNFLKNNTLPFDTNLSSTFKQPAAEFPKVLGLLDFLPSSPPPGLTEYKGKVFGVLIEYNTKTYGFVACGVIEGSKDKKGGPQVDNLLIVGCSQTSDNTETVKKAWDSYKAHKDAFGRLVPLPKFYSGREDEAKTFYETQAVLKAVEGKITGRIADKFTITPLKDSAWFINKGETELVVSCFEIASKDMTTNTCNKYNMFVAVQSGAPVSNANIVVGPFQKNVETMMQNLADYSEETYLLEPIEEEFNPYIKQMATLSAPMDALTITSKLQGAPAVDALIFVVDFATRSLSLKFKDDDDRTPYINKGLAVVNILVEQHHIEHMPTLCAALLHELPQENITLGDIERHFGLEVRNIVETRRSKEYKQLESDFPKFEKQLKNESKTFLEAPANQGSYKTANFDGKYKKISAGIAALLKEFEKPALKEIWQERRNKLSKTIKKIKYTENFEAVFVDAFNIGGKDYGVYRLTEPEGELLGDTVLKTPRVFYSTVEYKNGTPYKDQVGIVGELRKTGDEKIKKQMLEDYTDADIFRKIYKKHYARAHKKGTDPEVGKFTRALLYAAQKHSYQCRKDINKRPYFIHLIGVAKIAIKNGNGILTLETKIACVLHDTVENTSATVVELEAKFEKKVSEPVDAVSDDRTTPDGKDTSPEENKVQQAHEALTMASVPSVVKGSDRVYNLSDTTISIPPVFSAEKTQFSFSISRELHKNFKKNVETRQSEWSEHAGLEIVMENILKKMEQKFKYYPAIQI